MNVHESLSHSPAQFSLAAELRERTKRIHVQAEKSGIIADMLRGRIERHGYALLLRNLLPAYEVLEAGLMRHRDVPGIGPIVRPEIFRAQSLQDDLQAIAGQEWQAKLPVLPAGRDYAERITYISEHDSAGLIAHAYARYLGDLSGGQILMRLLGKSLQLEASALRFYEFPALPDLAAAKSALREAIDRCGREAEHPERIAEEAIAAFRHNIAVSEAVKRAAVSAA